MTAVAIKSVGDFEALLASFGAELRQMIELECEAFPIDAAAANARKERAHTDYEFFCSTYFPHYVRTPYRSSFQRDVFIELPLRIDAKNDARVVWMAPRGEAKSTYVTQLGVLWCLLTGRKHFAVLLMDSTEQATEMLEAIKAELDSNPRLASDWPEASGAGRVWQATSIITRNNAKVRVGGSGKRIRGMRHGPYRPDLVVIDDLENDENVRQKAQRDKTESWVLNAVLNLGPPAGGMDVFYVGTSLHYDGAINRLAKSPGWDGRVFRAIEVWPNNLKLWEEWELILKTGGSADADKFYAKNQRALSAGARVSWPEVRPLKRLMEIRAVNHSAFDREYQNAPGNDDSAPFKNIQFWTEPKRSWLYFGALDPSLGKHGSNRDPSAILVVGFDRASGELCVVEADIQRRVPDLIIARVIDLQQQYQCVAWAVEAVQFQAFMFDELVKRSAAAGIPVPAVPVIPHTDKALRIQSLQPHISNGVIKLHLSQTTLIEQLRFWPEADHDDGPDAMEMAWKIAQCYAGEWTYTSAGRSQRGRVHSKGWDDE